MTSSVSFSAQTSVCNNVFPENTSPWGSTPPFVCRSTRVLLKSILSLSLENEDADKINMKKSRFRVSFEFL